MTAGLPRAERGTAPATSGRAVQFMIALSRNLAGGETERVEPIALPQPLKLPELLHARIRHERIGRIGRISAIDRHTRARARYAL